MPNLLHDLPKQVGVTSQSTSRRGKFSHVVGKNGVVGVNDGHTQSEGGAYGCYVSVGPQHLGVADPVEEVKELKRAVCVGGEFLFKV